MGKHLTLQNATAKDEIRVPFQRDTPTNPSALSMSSKPRPQGKQFDLKIDPKKLSSAKK